MNNSKHEKFNIENKRKIAKVKFTGSVFPICTMPISILIALYLAPNELALHWKIATVLFSLSLVLCINVFIYKVSIGRYNKWYKIEQESLIRDVVRETWKSGDYQELKKVLGSYPLKTLYILFIDNRGIKWDKTFMEYENLEATIEFLRNNPCKFEDIDSSEYTLDYIRCVMPSLISKI